jgi:hypothetical protein
MAKVKSVIAETAESRWSIEIDEHRPGEFTCEYHGTRPKYAPVKRAYGPTAMMEDVGHSKFMGGDVEFLEAKARTEIEQLDGPIEKYIERPL